MIKHGPKPDEAPEWDLVSLTPEYLDREHGGYVRAIEAALDDKQILNIALSGSYGVGKSSILRELARRQSDRSLELSLSTLAPVEDSEFDDSVPIQATTSTNRIQQEIVKQLLYRQTPSKAQGSRFRRIERFQWRRELAKASIVGLVFAFILLLTGWSSQTASVFAPLVDLGLWIHPVMWAVLTTVVWLFRYLFYGQFQIKQLSAGSATVTLDDSSVSYFDQYLDEIVYFFEISEQDIVIFEDIDRFNDSHIFETLRALNTLLNASPQINRPIRFIYAIKDSIFDRIGLEEEGRNLEPSLLDIKDPAQAEAVRANRTKFFDLVIPVVPFITHRSARNLVAQLLKEIKHEVEPELLDLAAQYVPDMRLLKNVRNEFIVFRDRIFSGDGKTLKLSETDLFAMMLYKSTHLKDFEAIRIGQSCLDTLYKVSRDLVTENIRRIEKEQRDSRRRLARLNSTASRSEQLGKLLLAHVNRTLQAVGYREHNPLYSFSGKSHQPGDLTGEQFWEDFVSADESSVLEWQDRHYGHRLTFSREHLIPVLNDPLDIESWNKEDRDILKREIAKQADQLELLRSADMGDLMNHSAFRIEHEGEERGFDSIVRSLLSSGLAYQLVRAGYINRNFTLYTSTFHGDRVSPAATNFIIHHVERDSMDIHFELNAKDTDAVIRERGKNALKESALYNIHILDHLLQDDAELADIMIGSLTNLGDRQSEFVQAYLGGGAERTRFIERFTLLFSKMLIYLVNEAEVDDALRLDLVSTALAHLDGDITYEINSSVSTFLRTHYSEITALTTGKIKPSQADRIAALFSRSGVILPSLEPLADNIRQPFIALNLFEISRENLTLVLGSGTSLSLDSIQKYAESLYDYVLNNLGQYLSAIEGVSQSVDSPQRFIRILEDVLERDSKRLSKIIEMASGDCMIMDLEKVAAEALPTLAKLERFPATLSNVQHYVETIGTLDDNLATLLASAGKIDDAHKLDEVANVNLAIRILAARDTLPSARVRADLVASLAFNSHLPIESIAPEEGELFSLLLDRDVIADDVSTYEHITGTDWATREAFISVSESFKDYMLPGHVQGDLAALLESDKIDQLIKSSIVEHADSFTELAERDELVELAKYAHHHNQNLSKTVVHRMARTGVPATFVIPHLEPHLTAIDLQELLTILALMEGDYPQLTVAGRDQPRVPDSPSNRALLERLKREDIVSTYKLIGSNLRVHKRR